MSDSSAAYAVRGDGAWQIVCVLVYLLLCVGTAWVWEPTHDEGVAWRQAIGHLWLPAPERAAPIATLYATLNGETERSASDVFDALMVRGGMHPPAYYLLLHWWTDWVGTARIALDLPAYLFGVLALFGIHRLTRRLVPLPTAPIWSMALLAASPWFVGFSNLAKPYAITVCLSLWAANALLAIDEQPKRAPLWRSLFVALSLLGLYCIYHYAFVLAWQGVLALLLALRRADRGREIGWVVAMGAAIGLGFAVWLPRLLQHLDITAADSHYFSGAVPLSEWPLLAWGMARIWALGESLRGVAAPELRLAWALLAIATAPLAVYSFSRGGAPSALAPDRDARLFWVSMLLLPLAIAAGDWWRGTHTLFISKLSFGLFPLGLIAIVRAWHALPSTRLRSIGLGAWLLLFGVASTTSIHSRNVSITPFEAIAQNLAESDSPRHLVVLSSKAQGYVIPFLLTARDAGVAQLHVAYAPAPDLVKTLDAAALDPQIDRVTLVSLAVTYRPQDLWRARQLHALSEAARLAGWRVARLSPGASLTAREQPRLEFADTSATQSGPTRGIGKTLVITELANVKYYSMEVAGNPDAILMRP